jgi:hypothetical protein
MFSSQKPFFSIVANAFFSKEFPETLVWPKSDRGSHNSHPPRWDLVLDA